MFATKTGFNNFCIYIMEHKILSLIQTVQKLRETSSAVSKLQSSGRNCNVTSMFRSIFFPPRLREDC